MKKLLLALATVLVVAGGVAALSAYEAHIINVTAHIENALSVAPKELAFGTVFPQEYTTKEFTVSLSDSFKAQIRLADVSYKIEQKPKCIDDTTKEHVQCVPSGETCVCPAGSTAMLDLCEFLSKLPKDTEVGDVGHPSYYQPSPTPHCATPSPALATGNLNHQTSDDSDTWIVDLKVPPVAGYVGQEWPAGCPTVPENDKNYGCDLWVEVTGFSTPSPS